MKRTFLSAVLTGEPGAARHVEAWLLLVCALAVHVADEASTGFLDFYNPLVRSARSALPWLPVPTFSFGPWFAGLVVLVIALALMAPAVRRGGLGIRLASWVLSAIMFLNGIGHLAGSVYFQRWLPGATSAPLLLGASLLLARATWKRRRPWAGAGSNGD
ncbi:MAG: HXXEE domain-containing protein [Acidobacteriota bacterium]